MFGLKFSEGVEEAFAGNGLCLPLASSSLQTVGRGLVITADGLSIENPKVSRRQVEIIVDTEGISCFLRGINPSCLHREGQCLLLQHDQKYALQIGDVVSLLADHSAPCFRVTSATFSSGDAPATATGHRLSDDHHPQGIMTSPISLATIEESPSNTASLQRKYDELIKLSVHAEEAQGLDVRQLVETLHERSMVIANLREELTRAEGRCQELQGQNAALRSSELGTVAEENVRLRAHIEKLQTELTETRSLLASLKESVLNSSVKPSKKKKKKALDDAGDSLLESGKKKSKLSLDLIAQDTPVEIQDEDEVMINKSKDPEKRHFSKLSKGDLIVSLDDCVCIANSVNPSTPLVAKVVDIFLDKNEDEPEVTVSLEWFYRYEDLQQEDIAGRELNPSEISRNRELWPCRTIIDTNPAYLVVGTFKVLDLSLSSAQRGREFVEAFCNESEHHFFSRRKVDSKAKKVV